MTDPIRLSPCPFCGGPPVVMPQRNGMDGGGHLYIEEVLASGDAGYWGLVAVFCHECGAAVETDNAFLYDQKDLDELEVVAVRKWNGRLLQNLELYIAGDAEGQNWYPRAPTDHDEQPTPCDKHGDTNCPDCVESGCDY